MYSDIFSVLVDMRYFVASPESVSCVGLNWAHTYIASIVRCSPACTLRRALLRVAHMSDTGGARPGLQAGHTIYVGSVDIGFFFSMYRGTKMRKTVVPFALFIVNLPYVRLMVEVYMTFAALGRSDVPWYILCACASAYFAAPDLERLDVP